MKKLNKSYFEIALYTALVLCLVVGFTAVIFNYKIFISTIRNFMRIVSPLIIGFAIAYIIAPLIQWIEKKMIDKVNPKKVGKPLNRFFAMILGYGFLMIITFTFFAVVLPQIANSLLTIASQSKNYAEQITTWVMNIYEELRFLGVDFINDEQILIFLQEIFNSISSWLTKFLPQLLGYTVSAAGSVINGVVSVVVSIYVLISKERFKGQTKKMLYALFPPKSVNSFYSVLRDCDRIFGGFITGKLIDSLIIGIICYFSMNLLKIPEATLISVIVGVTNIIPYFGPFIGGIPSVLLLLFLSPQKALWFAIFVILLQQFDGNYLGPKILGDTMGISAFWVIFSVTIFGGLYGVMGMILGVPFFAVVYKLISDYVNKRIREKEYPLDTTQYAQDGFVIEPKQPPAQP